MSAHNSEDSNQKEFAPEKCSNGQQNGQVAVPESENGDKAWKDAIGEDRPWSSMSTKEKFVRVCLNICKLCLAVGCLYLFVCSLELLSYAFSIVSGKSTGALMNNEYMHDPIVGLMIGILLTVLVQSSSTSTSIIVSMVGADIIPVEDAIPMIMGANIGTSVTNTIVSLTQMGDRETFRRAFSGATVHDMFNWLAVIVLLPLEVITGVFEKLTGAIINSLRKHKGAQIEFLAYVTDPFVTLIIQINQTVLSCWGMGFMKEENTAITQYCQYQYVNITTYRTSTTIPLSLSQTYNTTTQMPTPDECLPSYTLFGVPHTCKFIFYETSLSDRTIGFILLAMALIILCSSLILLVKILNSLLQGSIAKVIQKVINADIPYVPWLAGYIALLVGAILTFIVQSSSVFTSTMTPLIGIGIISIDRAYPLTLGSNIGTTTTALLASLAVTGDSAAAVQIALVHFFFNVFGILLFYPIPFMRFPLPLCRMLGNITSQYRWFAIVYLVGMFFVLPVTVFGLSLGGIAVLWGVLGPILLLLVIIIVINIIQNRRPKLLPPILRNWHFLPLPFRSLEPYDKLLTAWPCCRRFRRSPDEEAEGGGHMNESYLSSTTTPSLRRVSFESSVSSLDCKAEKL